MCIIGLSGKAGTGKTTTADLLASMCDGQVTSFANALRDEVSDLFHIPVDCLRDSSFKAMSQVPVGYRFLSARELLQWWGALRREFNPDYWVDQVIGTADQDLLIIDDVRYRNEADAIKAAGGLLFRLEPHDQWRPGVGAEHISETDLDNYMFFDKIYRPARGLAHLTWVCRDIVGRIQQ
jgi:hypothetical protein